jgi:hypothetical protein
MGSACAVPIIFGGAIVFVAGTQTYPFTLSVLWIRVVLVRCPQTGHLLISDHVTIMYQYVLLYIQLTGMETNTGLLTQKAKTKLIKF